MAAPTTRWGDFNIDKHLAPIIPDSRLDRLPRFLSHFLGHRPPPVGGKPPPPPRDLLAWIWACAGIFLGMVAVAGVTKSIYGKPVMVGSIGATAILLFCVPGAPLSQPRNVLLSQLFASIIGVALARALPGDGLVAAGTAVAATALVMAVTKTVHPPAGATAVLAVVQGWEWESVGVVMVSTVVLGTVCAVWVNLWGGTRWPMWWVMQGTQKEVVKMMVAVGKDGVQVSGGLVLGGDERRVLEGIWKRIKAVEEIEKVAVV